MKRWASRAVLCTSAMLCVLFSWSAVRADIFACRDSRGTLRFTNAPSDASCRQYTMAAPAATERARAVLQADSVRPVAGEKGHYDQQINITADRYQLDPLLIKAIIQTESAFNARAVSRRGAQGLMQLMPSTARELQVRNPFNPHENIDGGSKYLRYLLDTFGGNLVLSLAAYNAGPGAVLRAGGVPRLSETTQYVVRVLKNYRNFRQLRS